MHVMRAVEGPDNVVWHAMEGEDTALCGETLPNFREVHGSRRRETFCVACMIEIEQIAAPGAAPGATPTSRH
ncbi:hypothetical protein [Embleya sp. MST-111070]|uniref:hypothetical protein n=1 Tax=Embleya sp. MST-111070 TaxID=3398231 RepID=UPI003F741F4C